MLEIGVICGIILSSTNAHFSGEATNMSALMKHLFEDQMYNPVIRPTHDPTTPTQVTVGMVILAVISLDTKEQILKTNGYITMEWKDELLHWDPSNYSNLDNLVIPQSMVWVPDAFFVNTASDSRYLGGEGTRLRVDNHGTVNWEPGFSTESTCQMDVSKYPFDANICHIHLVNWMSDNTTVQLNLASNPLHFSSSVTNGEYRISTSRTEKDQFNGTRGLLYDGLFFHIRLERRPGFFVVSVLIPVILLSLLGSVSFLLEPDEQEKLNVSITVLLSFTVFLEVIDSVLPTNSDNLSLFVVYVSSMFTLGFFGVLGNVVVIKVYRWEEEGRRATSEGQQDELLSRRAPRAENENQTNSLSLDSDVISSHSHMKEPEKNHASCGCSCLTRFKQKRKGAIASFINKVLFYVNGSLVIIMTTALWILMAT